MTVAREAWTRHLVHSAYEINLDRRFGFPDEQALANGQTGTECRGEEHDVVVVWSITSGKQQIMMDGREVHFTTNRSGVLEHSWTARGSHIIKVLCHASPPMTATPSFRQYDLFVDGQSYFTMPKMYELGLRSGTAPRDAGAYGGGGGTRSVHPPPDIKAPRSPEEENEDLQRAISASLAESRAHLEQRSEPPRPPPAPTQPAPPALLTDGGDLMSMGMGDPNVSGGYDTGYGGVYQQPPQYPQPPQYQQPSTYSQEAIYQQLPVYEQPSAYQQPLAYPTSNAGATSYPALTAYPSTGQESYAPQSSPTAPFTAPLAAPPSYGYTGAPPTPQSGVLPTESYAPTTNIFDSYAPEDPFAPKAAPPVTHTQMTSEILSAYASPTASTAVSGYAGFTTPDANDRALVTTNGESPGSMMKFEEEKPLNPYDAALKKLVNVDHIDQPAEALLTVKKKEDETVVMKKKGKSKGLPPAAHQVVGGQATLSQISEMKPKKEPKEDIMVRPPQLFNPEAQQAGMMVVYGQPGNQQGPPPLQHAQGGFGVGYYAQQPRTTTM